MLPVYMKFQKLPDFISYIILERYVAHKVNICIFKTFSHIIVKPL
jgi:hypothetical protein